MAEEARIDFDIEAEVREFAEQYRDLAEFGARAIADEIKAAMPDSEIPAAPGKPPHSTGPLRDSWKSGTAKRRKDRLTAYAYSLALDSNGFSLNIILDQGLGPVHPHPFIMGALQRAQGRLDSEISRVVASIRRGT